MWVSRQYRFETRQSSRRITTHQVPFAEVAVRVLITRIEFQRLPVSLTGQVELCHAAVGDPQQVPGTGIERLPRCRL